MKTPSLLKKFALCMAFQAVALPAMAQDKPPEPQRSSRYASVVINAANGEVLYERNADKQLRPASTTKILTAYLTFEALQNGTLTLDQELTVSRRAAQQARTNLAMITPVTITDKKTGKRRTEHRQTIRSITVENALKGMLVHSANDAAVVLAEAIGGSVEGFADKMNATAARLGMTDTHFMNPNGMPHTQQYTTVSDMAKLSAAVIADFPDQYHFFGNRTFRYNGTNYRNYNNLLGSYDGVDGLKTGYIHTSGFNLSASAIRDGQRVIAVVFGADNPTQRKADMTILLDYGFAVLGKQPKPALPENNLPPDDSEDPEENTHEQHGTLRRGGVTGFGFSGHAASLAASYQGASAYKTAENCHGYEARPLQISQAAPVPKGPEKDVPAPSEQPYFAPRMPGGRGRMG